MFRTSHLVKEGFTSEIDSMYNAAVLGRITLCDMKTAGTCSGWRFYCSIFLQLRDLRSRNWCDFIEMMRSGLRFCPLVVQGIQFILDHPFCGKESDADHSNHEPEGRRW